MRRRAPWFAAGRSTGRGSPRSAWGSLALWATAAVGCVWPGRPAGSADAQPTAEPVARAVAYLAAEVPRWSRENGCYSCHHNGDAARALYRASAQGYQVPEAALSDTTAWLRRPQQWRDNRGDPAFSDKTLANLQFALAARAASETGFLSQQRRAEILRDAARLVLQDRAADGCWQVGARGVVGSPATYGPILATVQARLLLQATDDPVYRPAIRRAAAWLAQQRPTRVFDAAALLYGSAAERHTAALRLHARCLEVLRRGRSPDGGWGPYLTAPPEPFDTALVLLALARLPADSERAVWIRQGRRYLVANQLPDGGWRETTRPANSQSYAQHISTTAWATLALLATDSLPLADRER